MTKIIIDEIPQLTELQKEEQNQVYGGVSAAASSAANPYNATASAVSSINRPVVSYSFSSMRYIYRSLSFSVCWHSWSYSISFTL